MKGGTQRGRNESQDEGRPGHVNLAGITPSRYFVAKDNRLHSIEYYPSRIILRDGTTPLRAIFIRMNDFELLYEHDEVAALKTDTRNIAEVLPVDRRLSPDVVELINRQHETGHNVICFILRTSRKGAVGYEGAAVSPGEMDFLELPIGYEATDVEGVEFVRCPLPSNLPRSTAPSWRDIRICVY